MHFTLADVQVVRADNSTVVCSTPDVAGAAQPLRRITATFPPM